MILAVDINALGANVLVGSDDLNLLANIINRCQHYQQLGKVLSNLDKAIVKVKRASHQSNQNKRIKARKQKKKIQYEKERVYQRRQRLLKQLHLDVRQIITTVIVAGNYSVLGLEELNLSARGTKGALAKAILSLPDTKELYKKPIAKASKILKRPLLLVEVDPRNTSQGEHIGCYHQPPGMLRRTMEHYHEIPCSKCKKMVNSHKNASLHIRKRANAIITNHSIKLPLSY